jgi:precorrin-2 dehydrogenase/sirohydrochlorin ferrochelatase
VKKTGTHTYFPILIDVRRLPCLVVGGGRVALRKVRSLVEFNATITVVSPEMCAGLTKLSKAGRSTVIKKRYCASFLNGHKIVFSATDTKEINRVVSHGCRRRGILLNVADGPTWCDFILPANLKRGDLPVSVSSQGKAPFFNKDTKRKLEDFLTPSLLDTAKLAGEFRRGILSKGIRM